MNTETTTTTNNISSTLEMLECASKAQIEHIEKLELSLKTMCDNSEAFRTHVKSGEVAGLVGTIEKILDAYGKIINVVYCSLLSVTIMLDDINTTESLCETQKKDYLRRGKEVRLVFSGYRERINKMVNMIEVAKSLIS